MARTPGVLTDALLLQYANSLEQSKRLIEHADATIARARAVLNETKFQSVQGSHYSDRDIDARLAKSADLIRRVENFSSTKLFIQGVVNGAVATGICLYGCQLAKGYWDTRQVDHIVGLSFLDQAKLPLILLKPWAIVLLIVAVWSLTKLILNFVHAGKSS